MKILNVKNWLEIKKIAKFEFIGNHKIRRLEDGTEFKLRFMYETISGNHKACIVYAYKDLVHVDIDSSSGLEFKKIHINNVNIIKGDKQEFLVYYV